MSHYMDEPVYPETEQCQACLGEGKLIIAQSDPDDPSITWADAEMCTTCSGEGWIEIDNEPDPDEWHDERKNNPTKN
jgi:DnaJ-class molecular chaperone